jgi:hypothetical protein
MGITGTSAPAMGDIRMMGQGDVIWLYPDVEDRKDWGRYLDAFAAAITRGAEVRWVR